MSNFLGIKVLKYVCELVHEVSAGVLAHLATSLDGVKQDTAINILEHYVNQIFYSFTRGFDHYSLRTIIYNFSNIFVLKSMEN